MDQRVVKICKISATQKNFTPLMCVQSATLEWLTIIVQRVAKKTSCLSKISPYVLAKRCMLVQVPKVAKGELKLKDIKGADGRVRYQPPTRTAAPNNRRQLSGINLKPGVALPAHLQVAAPKIDTEYPDRDVDYDEGIKGKPISEKLVYYRRNYRISYVWRRMTKATEAGMRKVGFGSKKMSTEEAKRKQKAEDYEIERRRRFQNRA